MEQVGNSSATAAPSALNLGKLPVDQLLEKFASADAVPGSGSANALAAAMAASLTASVAAKTYRSDNLKYVHIKQTAADIDARARRVGDKLTTLFEDDSAAFAPVIALRRETGKAGDTHLQDVARRKEVMALKPATEFPIEIARLSAEVGELALTMLDSGFTPARGESYTALGQAIAAIDGALYVAQLNVRTVKQRINKLNDRELEADWLRNVLRRYHRHS
jgi:formiminotetrahydrofolate cyclodeaminase